jgi:hypothetical protein
VRAVRRWFIQKRDRLGRVHKLWSRNVLDISGRDNCRGVPRVPRELELAGGQHRGGQLHV